MAAAPSVRPPAAGWRSAAELVVAVLGAAAIALVAVGFGGVVFAAALGVGLQLLAGAGYGPELWPGTRRVAGAMRLLPAAIVFWGVGLALIPRAGDELTTAQNTAALAAGLALYVVLSTWAARRAGRVVWAWPLVLLACYAPLAAATAYEASKPAPAVAHGLDLRAAAGERLSGAQGWKAGQSLAAAGDLNGDGKGDLLVGAPAPGYAGGSVFVVYGHAHHGTAKLAAFGREAARGFRIRGPAGGEAGAAVASVRDQNGDGRREILIGAPGAANARGEVTGDAYLLFGRPSREPVDLERLGQPGGAAGYVLDGAFAGDATGYSVADAGDVNGDAVSDLVVGAPRFTRSGDPSGIGAVYVVWGRRHGGRVDLAAIGPDGGPGYRLVSTGVGTAGVAVANVGDVNGDGRPDLAVGAPDQTLEDRGATTGVVYVVFGQTARGTVNLALVGGRGDRQGFRIVGAHGGDLAGRSVAAAGDVNRDGRPDMAIGAPFSSNNSRPRSGAAYVLFGGPKSGTVDLRELAAADGYRIDGAKGGFCYGVRCGDEAGRALANVGDVNGDRRPDLLVGAPAASNGGRALNGSAYVVFGQGDGDDVDLARVGVAGDRHGYRLDGAYPQERTGSSVAAAGDLDGDGRPDLALGAPEANLESGSAYAVLAPPRPR